VKVANQKKTLTHHFNLSTSPVEFLRIPLYRATMFLPLKVLEERKGRHVLVTLQDGHELEGRLIAFDNSCNILLQNAVHFCTAVAAPAATAENLTPNAPRLLRRRVQEYDVTAVPTHAVHAVVAIDPTPA
jgi:small nuclear ribonucleoprotein (snRNP)-like protein